jgi:phosphatidylglycerol:prolipoprotein diacylglycerol transferase
MASHGGFIGVALAMAWIAFKFKIPFLLLGDLLSSIVPVGLFLGRIANFINGELWGKVTTVPWAVIFPNSALPGTPFDLIAPRHPSQLYEAALEGLVLLAYTQWRLWRTNALKTPGRLSGEFLILYAIVRIVGEQFREPDAGLIFGMSRGIFFSLFLLAAGVLVIFHASHRNLSREKP